MNVKWVAWVFALGVAVIAVPGFGVVPFDGAAIVNSGSTNRAAWKIDVRADGSGVAYMNLPRFASQAQGAAYVVPLGSTPPHNFTISAGLAAQFFRDLSVARNAGARGASCVKSASFGSETTVEWHTWNSPDFECPQSDSRLATLRQDVRAVEEQAGIVGFHRVSLPSEPRATPQRT